MPPVIAAGVAAGIGSAAAGSAVFFGSVVATTVIVGTGSAEVDLDCDVLPPMPKAPSPRYCL